MTYSIDSSLSEQLIDRAHHRRRYSADVARRWSDVRVPLAPEQRCAFFDIKKRAVKHLSILPRPSPGQALTPCITFGLSTVPVQLSKKL